jgi:hypothetical protein
VRLLFNCETASKKLMQIVLAGQPQLADKLASSSLEQLRKRISMVIGVRAFNREETSNYIEHRLKVAGYTGAPLFSEQAITRIAALSEGIPRNINNFGFNTMSLAFAQGKTVIDETIVSEVADDLDWGRLATNVAAKRDLVAPGFPHAQTEIPSARSAVITVTRIPDLALPPVQAAAPEQSAPVIANEIGLPKYSADPELAPVHLFTDIMF